MVRLELDPKEEADDGLMDEVELDLDPDADKPPPKKRGRPRKVKETE